MQTPPATYVFDTVVPSPPSADDYLASSIGDQLTPLGSLPASVDLSGQMLSVRRDPGTGAAAFATSAMREYFAVKLQKIGYFLSPQFIYDVRSTSGPTIHLRDALNTLKTRGVCPDKDHPLSSSDTPVDLTTGRPAISDTAISNALAFRATSYWRVSSVDDARQWLYEFGPLVFMIDVFACNSGCAAWNMWKPSAAQTSDATSIGGHAMCFVGYNDQTRQLKVRNSWGPTWNGDGHCFMSYDDWSWVVECWGIDPVLPPSIPPYYLNALLVESYVEPYNIPASPPPRPPRVPLGADGLVYINILVCLLVVVGVSAVVLWAIKLAFFRSTV